jgi:hypothetical protein
MWVRSKKAMWLIMVFRAIACVLQSDHLNLNSYFLAFVVIYSKRQGMVVIPD